MQITSTEPYKSNGLIGVKEISIKPWQRTARLVLEICIDERENIFEMWELTCLDLNRTDGIPILVPMRPELKLYFDHPLLWTDKVYFSVSGVADSIPALMGDLFIEHSKGCGNWVPFHSIFGFLPKILKTQDENQSAIPVQLKKNAFQVLERHGIQVTINSVESERNNDKVLLFSCEENWPDSVNFWQPHIIAKDFSARRLK